jgi:ornithine carbamoyltransferase
MTRGIYPQGISTCNLTGSNQSGRKRRFASRHIQDAGCFRIPKNTKIFVSVAVEMHFLQNEYVVRTFAQHNLEELAEYSAVPVINALSDFEHPCQALADLLTIYEIKGKLKWLTVAYIGDGNNVANSLMLACAMTGMNFNIASPKGFAIDASVLKKAQTYAKTSGSKIFVTEDPQAAARDADVIYTDTWTSMGQEAEAAARRKAFAGYQVNEKLLALTRNNSIIMHCLPAHHGEEVAAGLLDSPRSVVFDQAENRLHAQKALLAWIFAKK